MTCKNQIPDAHNSIVSGGVNVTLTDQKLITYKCLTLTKTKKFKSPDREIVRGKTIVPRKGEFHVVSYLWDSHSSLKRNYTEPLVLVTLEISGDIRVDEDVVFSDRARIIGYDQNDYYFSLWKLGWIDIETARANIPLSSTRFGDLILADETRSHFTDQDMIDHITSNPDPKRAFLFGLIKNLHEFRNIASQSPEYAYEYASQVDKGPHEVTRAGACKDHKVALKYALWIDQGPHADTREAVSIDSQFAYVYANFIEGPHEYTRKIACLDPKIALEYALDVDQSPHAETRKAVAKDPDLLIEYALKVEKGPHPVTRALACKASPDCAFRYALQIDKGPHDETRAAACQDPWVAFHYAALVDQTNLSQTRNAACKNPETAYFYAVSIDRFPSDKIRRAVSGDTYWDSLYTHTFQGIPEVLIADQGIK